MLREISEEVRVNLKDRLRDVRHVVRQHRHDSPAVERSGETARARPFFPRREIEGLLGHAISAFDDAMGLAQTLVPRTHSGNTHRPKGFAAYFPADGQSGLDAERAFRRDMYSLTRMMLARRKLVNVRVHEADFVAIHAAMRRRHQPLLAMQDADMGWAEKVSLAAELSAALLGEFLTHRPLRTAPAALSSPMADEIARNDAVACLAPVALACGLASVDPDGNEAPDLIDMAVLAIDARSERVVQACDSADPQSELTVLFAMLLTHLP
ncbi:hypothetical protein [Manganibacter manganicus]|uniref:Uncharacterized protein n=1 Tax=Manganibacter manganicus TaxID=1873176 RepID=A0A1V8RVQ1_9HYPH|nr:hypothetical protein [Pseudaminobacter manganicus]OQM77290.1 hypothetical protein BFN67_00080 [Pseudaminobacter manganicus]